MLNLFKKNLRQFLNYNYRIQWNSNFFLLFSILAESTQFYWPCMVTTQRNQLEKIGFPVVTWCISWTDLICSVHQEPSRQKVACIWACMCSILRVHSKHSLFSSIHKFTDLICSVHQDPNHRKVASIWANMCSILSVHRNHSLCLSIPKFPDLICSIHQDPSHQKWLPFELICEVYLEYIATIHFVRPYTK